MSLLHVHYPIWQVGGQLLGLEEEAAAFSTEPYMATIRACHWTHVSSSNTISWAGLVSVCGKGNYKSSSP